MGARWEVDRRAGSPSELHAGWPQVEAQPTSRRVAVCRPDRPAVVLGSTQAEATVDRQRLASRGATLARRRSGGGAVWVAPDDPVWIDLWLPAGDDLWMTDVTVSFEWVGTVWSRALEAVGVPGTVVHQGRAVPTTGWASLVCFGGLGAGEVSASGGRKVVGLAQRRTRQGAWYHGAVYARWDPGPLLDVLAIADEARARALGDLRPAVAGLSDWCVGSGDSPADGLVDRLLTALP